MKRLYGDDGSYIKLYELDNGYQFASRKARPVPEGNYKPDAVVVIAHDAQGRLLVIREKRPVAGGYIWALPAGKVDVGESFLQAAEREVREETGLQLMIRPHTHPMFSRTFASPGITDEIVAIVHGEVEGTISNEHLDGDEDIKAYLMSPDDMQRAGFHRVECPMSMWLALAIN